MYFLVDVDEMNGEVSLEDFMSKGDGCDEVVITDAFLLPRDRNRVR